MTRLIKHNGNSLFMEGVMLGKNHKTLKSISWIEFKHFDIKKGKLANHCDELMELFDKISIKGINTKSFDDSVKEIFCLYRNNLQTTS